MQHGVAHPDPGARRSGATSRDAREPTVRLPALTGRTRRRRALWQEIHRIAREDLAGVAAAIADLEEAAEAHPAARDAYYRAVALHARAEHGLVVAGDLDALRAVCALAADARAEIAAARSLLAGADSIAPGPPCLFDPAHGPSTDEVLFAPSGGAMERVRACAACAEEVRAGRAPDLRRVIVDGRPQPYWRSPTHAGYFGRGSQTLDELLLAVPGGGGWFGGGADGIGLLDWLDELIDTRPR